MSAQIDTHWDAIVVGARCAGATVATLLARQGWKVLMLDSTERGSNKAMSTHFIRAPGIDVLTRLGLGDKLAAQEPRDTLRFALDDAELLVSHGQGQKGYCIRRHLIDGWLQEHAESSGVTFLDQHRVTGLIADGDRVTGVVAKAGKTTARFRATWVIGADGAHSTVARLVGAREYLAETETERRGYWAYFPEPKVWPYDWDASLEYKANEFRFVFRCDDNLMLLAYGGLYEEVSRWGKDKENQYRQALQGSPTTARLIENNPPASRLIGVANAHFYYRKPYGKGYALAGDAGHYIHYSSGWGMAHAFCNAEKLSDALLDGRPEALEYFWRERDANTVGNHFDALNQAKLSNNNPLMREVVTHINNTPELLKRAQLMTQGELSPEKLVPGSVLNKVVWSALLQGRFDIPKAFLRVAPRIIRQSFIIKQYERQFVQARNQLLSLSPTSKLLRVRVAPIYSSH